ncbi:MAG: PHP domain-containing protein [bacterium]
MILDLHVHSTFSQDSPVTVEEYAAKAAELCRDFHLDGFVLMEHNYLVGPSDCDLKAIGQKYGLVVLAGVEIDTYWGHMLVYGINRDLWTRLQEGLRPGFHKVDPEVLANSVEHEKDMALVPAHPYRFFIGAGDKCTALPGIFAIEVLNGANEDQENQAALDLARKTGWAMTGGSDAHFLPELGSCLTEFARPVSSMPELAAEIKAGRCRPLTREEARKR